MTTRPRPAPSNDRNAPSQERAAYLVLGMHRSGTSAMASVLALAGAEMPEDLMPGDEHNAKGYFEPWKIAMLNGERLRAGQSAWDDPFSFPYQPLDAQAETDWIDRACDLLKSEYGRANFPLIKDPRVSVLMPLWRTALEQMGMPIRVVIPIRHPLEVAGSLTRRDRFPVEKSVLLWCSYMLASEVYSRGLPRAFVAYDSLLKDWRGAVSRIEAAHGKALPRLNDRASRAIDDFLTSDQWQIIQG